MKAGGQNVEITFSFNKANPIRDINALAQKIAALGQRIEGHHNGKFGNKSSRTLLSLTLYTCMPANCSIRRNLIRSFRRGNLIRASILRATAPIVIVVIFVRLSAAFTSHYRFRRSGGSDNCIVLV